jgi:hypothetical protein
MVLPANRFTLSCSMTSHSVASASNPTFSVID